MIKAKSSNLLFILVSFTKVGQIEMVNIKFLAFIDLFKKYNDSFDFNNQHLYSEHSKNEQPSKSVSHTMLILTDPDNA